MHFGFALDLWNIDLWHVFKTCLQHVFKSLQDVLRDVFKEYLQEVFKTFSRRFQEVLEDKRLTCLEEVFQTSWRPTNVCWVWVIQTFNKTYKDLKNMETKTGNPNIQRLQCTAAIHVILVLPTLNVHFVSKSTQAQNATLGQILPREKLYCDLRLNVLFI